MAKNSLRYGERNWDRPLELVLDEVNYKNALRDITAEPLTFAYSCLYRARQLWSPLPSKLTAGERKSIA